MPRKLKDYDEEYFSNLSVAGIIARVIGVVLVIAVVVSVIGFIGGWFNAGKDIVSADNAKKQSYAVRQDWNSMINEAQNACSAQHQAARDPNSGPQLVEDPALAYVAQYRNTRADFNRLQKNPFENGITHYAGYPTHVPVFAEENKARPNYCLIANHLLAMHE